MASVVTMPYPSSPTLLEKANELLSVNIKAESELFTIVLRHLAETVNVQDAWVVRYDPEKNYLVRMVGTGLFANNRPGGPIADECPVGHGVTGLAYQSCRVVSVTNYSKWPKRMPFVPSNIRWAVACPILLPSEENKENPYGVLACYGDQPETPDNLIVFVSQYALILGLALHNLMLRKSLCAAEITNERIASMASRMEAVFHATSSIVHDFRNVLMAISGRAELLTRILADLKPPSSNSVRRNIDAIQNACELNNELCETLLNIIRGSKSITSHQTSIPSLVLKLERILRHLVQRKGQLTIEASCQPVTSPLISEESIIRLLINLVTNAIEAEHPEREMEVSLRIYEHTNKEMEQCLESPGEILVLRSDGRQSLFVVFEVKDTGHGISKETAERMFDLLYTTKEKGTGLGLPIVYHMTKECGGHLTYNTGPSGTRFRVYIPAVRMPDSATGYDSDATVHPLPH